MSGIQQPAFSPISSALTFGPPVDISMGWDGTLWAIDASGAPHIYDPVADAWQLFGEGLDGAAWIGDTYYFFRGNEYAIANFGQAVGAPQPISGEWASLPYSFTLGVTGAASVSGTLFLFKAGWYVPANGSAAPAKLTDLQGWPQAPNWVDGVIDAVSSDGSSTVVLFQGSEYLTVDLQSKTVTSGPAPISNFAPWQGHVPDAWLSSGIDGAFVQPGGAWVVYNGPAFVTFQPADGGVASPEYIAALNSGWPVTWNPALGQAPGGRVGNLWATTTSATESWVISHDGTGWSVANQGQSASVAVGVDGTVFSVGLDATSLWQWNGTDWDELAAPDSPLAQVSVGDGSHVWARDSNGNVYCFDAQSGAYNGVDLGVPASPTDMTANSDGTLWSCSAGDGSAYRFISEASTPSESLTINQNVTGVQKVASTGFGSAHCLVQQNGNAQIYRYDSPYLFKTSQSYPVDFGQQIVEGLTNLYIVTIDSPQQPPATAYVVALDSHTGVEVARSTPMTGPFYGRLAFDPNNELVYVGVYSSSDDDQTTPGQLLALDARDLSVVWSFDTAASVDAAPVLSGTSLCFGDRQKIIYKFNTRTALAQAKGGETPAPDWTWTVPTNSNPASTHRVATPLVTNGMLYAAVWDVGTEVGDEVFDLVFLAQCNALDGSASSVQEVIQLGKQLDDLHLEFVCTAPVIGQAIWPGPMTIGPAVFVNCGFQIATVPLGSGVINSYALPSGSQIATGFAYDDGTRLSAASVQTSVWFGDVNGMLYGLDSYLGAVDNTPYSAGQGSSIYTSPVIYKDPEGGATVLFGLYQVNNPAGSLFGFDRANGNVASVPTGVTQIFAISETCRNGLVYAAGSQSSDSYTGLPAQVFGIRVDALPQALRDFVIESEMMQDYDDPPSGQTEPPATARYQTHLTVVDDQKLPRPNEGIKIWAEQANTSITIGTQQFTIGPNDNDYASVQTGVDGKLTLFTDATDVFATHLRVWSTFMNPYERMVVYPDQEFHARVTTAHANASDDDPDKVNLVTATNYQGTPLFTADEKSQGQPQNVANMLHTMSNSVGIGGSTNSNVTTKVFWSARTRATSGNSYIAYSDLPGMVYFPVNIPAIRSATITSPIGLSFSTPQNGAAPAFTTMSHADAAAAIDALEGQKWSTSKYAAAGAEQLKVGSWWTDFWNWLKGAVATITDFFISVGEEIYAGIRFIVDGIVHVFKAIVQIVEEVVAAIVTVFKELEKIIEDIIEAFSVLLHFDEIMKTQAWIAAQIQAQVAVMSNEIKNTVLPALDGLFQQGENAIKAFFDQLRQQLDPTKPISGLKGQGATSHTVFSVGPKGGTQNSSHAVQCTWAADKMNSGLPSASEPSALRGGVIGTKPAPRSLDATDDPLSDFISAFIGRLTGDGDLSSVFSQFQQDVNNLFTAASAKDFFATLLVTLLDALESLLVGALAIGNAFADGLLNAFDAVVAAVMNILTTTIEIPVLSALYQWIFGQPLTFLNLITLVGAIPVTIIYRVVEGHYPSQDIGAANAQPASATQLSPIFGRLLGVFGAIATIVAGIVNAVADAEGEAPPIVGKIALGLGFILTAVSFPLIGGGTPTSTDWACFGVTAALGALNIFGVISFEGAAQSVLKVLLPVIEAILSAGLLSLVIVDFIQKGDTDADSDVGFAANLTSTLPGLINPLKLIGEELALLVAIVDGVAGFVVGGLDIYVAWSEYGSTERMRRITA